MTRNKYSLLAALLIGTLFAVSAQADFIISAPNLTAAPGGSGEFQIALTSTSSYPVSISAFTFDISTTSPNVMFTGAKTGPDVPGGYIYAGNSFAENQRAAVCDSDRAGAHCFGCAQ